jgi:hypothetical protein
MLKTLRRWLGWDSSSGPFDFGDLEIPSRLRPTPGVKAPIAAKPPMRAQSGVVPPGAVKTPAKPATRRKREPDPLDVLDNPKLTLERPTTTEDGFDPYNTGAFNRSASWERISRKR